jgi:hypothetical protein
VQSVGVVLLLATVTDIRRGDYDAADLLNAYMEVVNRGGPIRGLIEYSARKGPLGTCLREGVRLPTEAGWDVDALGWPGKTLARGLSPG